MRRALIAILAVVAAVAAVAVVRALRLESRQVEVAPVSRVALDRLAIAETFAGALRFRTVSSLDAESVDWSQFDGLRRYLEERFPLVHQRLKRELVGGHTILLTWDGADPDLLPVVLLSHQDVVPVEPGAEAKWTHPPWDGRIADGFVWGRGALDDKFGVVGLLQAAEILLAENFRPRRTVYFVFGHDEEVGGDRGAKAAAALLESRGVRAELVLDEGGAVTLDAIPGVERRVALVGTAEKGSVSLELVVDAPGGHSSTPPEHTAIGIVSAAVNALEERQMPMALRGPTRQLADFVAPELPFGHRLVLANLWLVQPLIERFAAGWPPLAATLRTTTAATMIRGGVKENVLPSSASAVINFRILPGDRIADVEEHVRRVVADGRVGIEPHGVRREASPEAPVDGPAFTVLARSIREVFPDAVVAPFLVLGGTDSRHFGAVSANIYRFTPIVAEQRDLTRIHGTDERMSLENYEDAVQFFVRLLRNAAGGP